MAERVVAIGLLTERDLSLLGPTFDRAWPVEDVPCFTELLRAIDDADDQLQKAVQQMPGAGDAAR